MNLGIRFTDPVIHEFKWLKEYIPHFEFVSWGDDENPVNGSTEPIPESCQFPYKERYIQLQLKWSLIYFSLGIW